MDMESKDLKGSVLQVVSQHSVFCINKKKLYLRSVIIFFIVFDFGLFQVAVTPRPVLLGNERAHVRLLHSAVINGNFEINPDKTDVSYYNGRYYSNKPPGLAFILMPAYRIYTWLSGIRSVDNAFLFVKFSNIVFSSLSAVVVFLFLHKIQYYLVRHLRVKSFLNLTFNTSINVLLMWVNLIISFWSYIK